MGVRLRHPWLLVQTVSSAVVFCALIHASAWSDVLLEGGSMWGRNVGRAAVIGFSSAYAGLVLFASRAEEWMRGVLTLPPAALALGIALAAATLGPVWQRPGYANVGYMTVCAAPVLLVAPLSVILAGVVRAVRNARQEHSLGTDPR